MTELASEFRAWVLAQAEDYDLQCPDGEHVLIDAPNATAHVTFTSWARVHRRSWS